MKRLFAVMMASLLLISAFSGVSVAQTSDIESNLADEEIEFDNEAHSGFNVDNSTYRIAELEFDVSDTTSVKDLSYTNAGDSGYQTGFIGVSSDGTTTEIGMLTSSSTVTSVDLSQYDQIIVQQMADVDTAQTPIIARSTSLEMESLENSPSVSTGDSIGDTISEPIQLRNPGTQFEYEIVETSTGESLSPTISDFPSATVDGSDHFTVTESSISGVSVEVWVVESVISDDYTIADPVGIDFSQSSFVQPSIETGENVTEINQIEVDGPVPSEGNLEVVKIDTPDGTQIDTISNNGTVDLEQRYDVSNVTVTVFDLVAQESTIKGNNVDDGVIGGVVDGSDDPLDGVDNQTLGIGIVGIVALLGVFVAARD